VRKREKERKQKDRKKEREKEIKKVINRKNVSIIIFILCPFAL
jgi:hypothetical protein